MNTTNTLATPPADAAYVNDADDAVVLPRHVAWRFVRAGQLPRWGDGPACHVSVAALKVLAISYWCRQHSQQRGAA